MPHLSIYRLFSSHFVLHLFLFHWYTLRGCFPTCFREEVLHCPQALLVVVGFSSTVRQMTYALTSIGNVMERRTVQMEPMKIFALRQQANPPHRQAQLILQIATLNLVFVCGDPQPLLIWIGYGTVARLQAGKRVPMVITRRVQVGQTVLTSFIMAIKFNILLF